MMTEEVVQPTGKKRGRPKGSKNPTKEKKAPPACETTELEKYKNPSKYAAWGLDPVSPGFKGKGVTILENEDHPGGQATLLPVKKAEDGVEGMRWRYRWVGKGVPRPFSYEMFPLEPGEFVALYKQMGRFIKDKGWDDIRVADKTTEEFHKMIKDDELGKKIKEMKVF
jgi:hypothetical protein